MLFEIIYYQQMAKDIKKLKLTKFQLIKLKKKIEDISHNPFPKQQGGLGELLSGNLKGLLKFRFDNDYRVIYSIVKEDNVMKVIVIGMRADKLVYKEAGKRLDF